MCERTNPSTDILLQLAHKIRQGDLHAFERLYKHFYAPLCEFVFRYVKNKEVAEDIVQSLFLSIYEKGARWNPTKNVKTYIYTSAKHRALNYLRDNKLHLNNRDAANLTSHPVQCFQTEEDQYYKDLQRALQDAYECMPEKRRVVFLLSRESDLTYKEISTVLNISVKTVETQMGRALKALRKELKHFLILVKN